MPISCCTVEVRIIISSTLFAASRPGRAGTLPRPHFTVPCASSYGRRMRRETKGRVQGLYEVLRAALNTVKACLEFIPGCTRFRLPVVDHSLLQIAPGRIGQVLEHFIPNVKAKTPIRLPHCPHRGRSVCDTTSATVSVEGGEKRSIIEHKVSIGHLLPWNDRRQAGKVPSVTREFQLSQSL